jgi:PST family polysaccharide transporter
MRAGVQLLVTVPTAIILARLLTPEEFGIAAAATFFGQLSVRLSSSGMGSALVRLKELRPEHIWTVFTFNAAVTVLIVLGLVAAAPFVGAFYGHPEVGWLRLWGPLDDAAGAAES